MNNCALNKSSINNTCLDNDHINIISNYTNNNSIDEIKKETNCSTDECILESINIPINIKEKIHREAFKPTADSLDGNYWLNNTEIDNCMSQFRKQYPGFTHTFIHMSDMKSFPPSNLKSFDYLVLPLTDINLPECIKNGLDKKPSTKELSTYNNVPLTSIGIVFNTDISTRSGQHWFSIFISLDNKDIQGNNVIIIELFNSSGTHIKNNIFLSYWENQRVQIAEITKCNCIFKLVSTIEHQRHDTGNCGSYSLFYIYSRLNNVSSEEFNKYKVSDKNMEKFRGVLFQIKK